MNYNAFFLHRGPDSGSWRPSVIGVSYQGSTTGGAWWLGFMLLSVIDAVIVT